MSWVLFSCTLHTVSLPVSQPTSTNFVGAHQLIKNFCIGYGWQQWCLGSLSHKWVPGDRPRWQLYLNYLWCLEACERVYSPGSWAGDGCITGLPGIIICKALWASFDQEKRYIRTAYYYYYIITSQIHNLSDWRSSPRFIDSGLNLQVIHEQAPLYLCGHVFDHSGFDCHRAKHIFNIHVI